MRRTFLFNIVLLLLVNLLIKPLYIFGIEIPVQNTVGNASYGFYFALLNFNYLFHIINDPGLQNYNSREISSHPVLIKKLLPRILILKSGLSVVFIATVSLAAAAMGYWKVDPLLLAIIMINQVFSGFALFLRTNVAAVGYYTRDSLLSIVDKLFMILSVGTLLWLIPGAPFNMRIFAVLQGAGFLLTAGLALGSIRSFLPPVRIRFVKGELLSLLRATMPHAAVIFLMFVYTRTDGVMIEALLADGDYEAGIYAAAFRLTDAFTMFTFLFAGLLLPMFSKLLRKGDPVSGLFRQGFEWITAIAIGLGVPVYIYRNEIMELLYTDTSAQSGFILGMLVLAFAFKATNFVTGTLLVASDRLDGLNRLLLATVVLNIAMNFILIPRTGAGGAAISTLITQVLAALGMFLLCLKFIHPKTVRLLLLKILPLALLLVLVGYFWPNEFLSMDWIAGFFVLAILVALMLLLFGLVRLGDFAYFTRKLGNPR